MNKLILILILSAMVICSNTEAAEWKKFYNDSLGNHYYDTKSVKKVSETDTKFKLKIIYLDNSGYALYDMWMNCVSLRNTTTKITLYSAKTKVSNTTNYELSDENWSTVLIMKEIKELSKYICK